MLVEVLITDGVRNLLPLELTPRERFNVFVGDNGQGKTNLLEAIFCVAALRSFRTTRLTDLIGFERPAARLAARVKKADLTRIYEVELQRSPATKRARLDGKAARPLSRYFGGFNVVVFTPEDLALPRGSPSDRRRFLDRGVFNLDAGYLAIASDYDKVVKTRNSVLRQAGEGRIAGAKVGDLLEVYDAQLAALAVVMVAARMRFLALIGPELATTF
ncbi:MAG: DNA replication and repair protein RecF, partial [Deltaproteobacteria bacterium]|nr:DNA replication and repair protein RecF [Deltaproteobacteria bacterium]